MEGNARAQVSRALGHVDLAVEAIKDKKYDGKLAEWVKRSKERTHTVELVDDMTSGGIIKIPKDLHTEIAKPHTLRLDMMDNKAVQRFSENFRRAFDKVEHIRIHGGDIDTLVDDLETHTLLHCNLPRGRADKGLKTIEVSSVDFRDVFIRSYRRHDGLYFRRDDQASARKRQYPGLESIVVSECKVDTVANPGGLRHYEGQEDLYSDDERGPKIEEFWPLNGRYKTCPLHVMLRASPSLRYLKIICHPIEGKYVGVQSQPPPSARVELPNVVRLIIPPVSVWTVDIRTSNVESLTFALADDFLRQTHFKRTLPMIPDIGESPVDIRNLAKLTHLGFECAESDTTTWLDAWLSRVPNLTSLCINGNKTAASTAPSTRTPAKPTHYSDPVAVSLLEALIDHPEWLPKLNTLEIAQCDVSDIDIVKSIKMRKNLPATTSLVKLHIRGRSDFSAETRAWLHGALRTPNGESGFSEDLRKFQHMTQKAPVKRRNNNADCVTG